MAAVAVVVPDDVVSACGELAAEAGLPAEELGPEAHDEQDGGVGRVTEGLVLEHGSRCCFSAHCVLLPVVSSVVVSGGFGVWFGNWAVWRDAAAAGVRHDGDGSVVGVP